MIGKSQLKWEVYLSRANEFDYYHYNEHDPCPEMYTQFHQHKDYLAF